MSVTSHMEIEARLLAVGSQREALFQRMRECTTFGAWQRAELEVLQLEDKYFDLDGAVLASRDCALRVRREVRGGEQTTLLTFKGPALANDSHCMERLELEGPWSPPILERIGAELGSRGVDLAVAPDWDSDARAVLAALGFSSLQTRQTRREAAPLMRGAETVAELTLDQVRYSLPTTLVVHREVEIEARAGSTASDVLAIAAELQAQFAPDLTPWRWSKTAVGRALEILDERGELAALVNDAELGAEGYGRLSQILEAR